MKHCTAPALLLAIIVALLVGRSVFVTAQAPEAVTTPPAAPQPAFPLPSVTTLPPGAPVFVQPLAPPVAAPQPPTVATLNDLVRALKDVRQKKAELQQEEEKLTTAIRKKIDEEKKLHEEVLQLLGDPNAAVLKIYGFPDPKVIKIEDGNTLPK